MRLLLALLLLLVVAAPADAARLYTVGVTSSGLELRELDTGSRTLVREIQLAGSSSTSPPNRGLVLAPDGRRAYVAMGADTPMQVVDLADGSLLPAPPLAVADGALAMSADGMRLWSYYRGADGAYRLHATDTRTHAAALDVAVAGTPRSIAVSPDGGTVVIGGYGAGGFEVSAFDTATGELRGTTTTPGPVNDVAFTPDGATIVAVDIWNVSLLRTTTLQPIAPTIPIDGTDSATVSPDGRVVAIANSVHGKLHVRDTRTGAEVATVDGVVGEDPSFTADGRQVVVTERDGNPIEVIDAATWTKGPVLVPVNYAPRSSALAPDQVRPAFVATTAGLLTGLDAQPSQATAGVASYRWDFGDGRTLTTRGETAFHLFAAPGLFPVKLSVVDANGCARTIATGRGVACNVAPAAREDVSIRDFAAGPAGPAGQAGSAGPSGPSGAVGATGPAGPAGPAGRTGQRGKAAPAVKRKVAKTKPKKRKLSCRASATSRAARGDARARRQPRRRAAAPARASRGRGSSPSCRRATGGRS